MSNETSSRVPAGVPTGGQFATTTKGEADVSLTPASGPAPYSDEAYEAPLSREELKAVWDKETELRRMEATDESVTLPDGSRARIVPVETVGDIVENGEYFIEHPDGEMERRPFADLSERGQVAAKIADEAMREHRAAATVKAQRAAAAVDTDPWGSDDSAEDDDVAGVCPDCENNLTSAQVADGYCPACAEAENAATIAVHVENEARLDAEDAAQEGEDDDEYEHPLFGKIIHSYTRADALRDGVLVDHSKTAKEAGIVWPVALTIGAQSETVTWTRGDAGQDETGRAWDVLMQCRRALGAQGNRQIAPGERIPFQVLRIPNKGRGQRPLLTTLHAVPGPGDDGAPCFTIMLPDED